MLSTSQNQRQLFAFRETPTNSARIFLATSLKFKKIYRLEIYSVRRYELPRRESTVSHEPPPDKLFCGVLRPTFLRHGSQLFRTRTGFVPTLPPHFEQRRIMERSPLLGGRRGRAEIVPVSHMSTKSICIFCFADHHSVVSGHLDVAHSESK